MAVSKDVPRGLEERIQELIKEAEYYEFDEKSSSRVRDYGEARKAERRAEEARKEIRKLRAIRSGEAEWGEDPA